MKSLQDILAEVQALATVAEDQFEGNLAQVVTDLQAVIAATPAAADPVASVTVTTASGASSVFVPQTA